MAAMTAHRIEEIRSPLSPQQQSAKARELLARLLADTYAIAPLPVIATLPTGKPYFPDHPHIHFNLSHCSKAVMAVIADSEVGCDIEEIQSDDDITPQLLEVAFSDDERRQISVSADRGVKLTRIWTRKEANVKRTGSIPDDPREWQSEMPGVSTCCCQAGGYIYSISH